MTPEQLKTLAARFAGSTVEIEFLVEVCIDQFDITPAAARQLIIEHLPVGRTHVFC